MFQNNKTGFGQSTANTTFGGGFSGGTTNAPFGQSAFGKPATSSFPTPAFGTGGNNLFGSTAPATGGLFGGATSTPVFGQTQAPQQSAFGGFQSPSTGGGLFGSQQNAATNLFGASTNTSSAFGAAKPAFGGFGTNQASGGLFGQQNQQPQATTSLFGQAPTQTNTGLFGSSGFGAGSSAAQASGTVMKFTPVNGSDTMVKNGTTQTISTRHHCITCMKDYEHKSLEELRFEDYAANRKGPQQGAQQGGLFGATAQTSLFGAAGTSANTSGGLFGANTSMGGFGSQSTGVFGQTNQQAGGLFGSKPTGFGTTATTSAPSTGFSFNSATANPFQTAAVKPFGTAAPQTNTLFGASTSQPSTGFGTPSTGFGFGAQPNQGMGLFGQPKTAFNNLATTSAGFSFGQQTQGANTNSLFGAKPATAAPAFGTGGGFGASATPGFGNTGSLFGQSQPAAAGNTSLFGQAFKPAPAFSFGQTPAANTGLGGNLGLGGQGMFNTAKPTGNLFGSNTGSMFNSTNTFGNTSSFGNNATFSLGGMGNQQLGGGTGGLNQGGVNTATHSHQQILALAAVPFGDSPLFKDLLPATGRADDLLKPTNPAAQKAALSANQFKVSPRSTQRLKTRPITASALSKKSLFEGIDQSDDLEPTTFSPRNNCRRLLLKPATPETPNTGPPIRSDTVVVTPKPAATNPVMSTPAQERPAQFAPNQTGEAWSPPVLTSSPSSNDASWLHVVPAMRKETNLQRAVLEAALKNATAASPEQNTLADDTADISINSSTSLDTEPSCAEDEVPHPCGVRLCRTGYYTIPPLTELDAITAEDGSCTPENFTVGREGYGNVYFDESFDVSGLDLDSIVHFRHKEVNLYPSDSDKPDVGQGLNRRAQVTLDKVWPTDKTTRLPITDVDRLQQLDYEGKLQRNCTKLKTRFLEYRPQTGSWVFKVEHFSKYGLAESDEEEDPVPSEKKKLKLKPGVPPPTKVAPLKPPAAEPLRLRDGSDILDDDEADAMFVDDDQWHEKGQKNVASHKVQQMKASFFGDDIETVDSDLEMSYGAMSRMQDDFRVDAENMNKSSAVIHRQQFDVQHMDTQAPLLRVMTPAPAPRRHTAQEPVLQAPPLAKPVVEVLKHKADERMPLSLSLLWQKTTGTPVGRPFDIALIKGGFRARWGPGACLLTLVTKRASEIMPLQADCTQADRFLGGRVPGDRSLEYVQRLQLVSGLMEEADTFQESVLPHLAVQLQHCQLGMESGCPAAQHGEGTDALRDHHNIARRLTDDAGGFAIAAAQALELCWALWGDLDDLQGLDNMSAHQEAMIRKEAVSSWLQNLVAPLVEAELADPKASQLQQILSLLSANRVSAACKRATNCGDYHLTLHLAQLGSSQALKQAAAQQLTSWQDTEADGLIEADRLKVMMLAAGMPVMHSTHGAINVCEELDWRRAFALHLWYLCTPVSTVTDALLRYEQAFCADESDDMDAYAAAPKTAHSADVRDLHYHLLRLHSFKAHPLERLLNPGTHTADPFDYRLSWILQQTLSSLGYTHASAYSTAVLHVNFAAQLESHGLWHWAVFVLMHLSDVDRRRTCVLEVVGRCVRLTDDAHYRDQEKFLVEKLGVPHRWIAKAKAVLALSLSRYHMAAEFLIEAGEWNQSHAVIIEHISADAINNERYDQLSTLLSTLAAPERAATIAGWASAGSVLTDFLAVMADVNALLADRDLADDYRMEQLLPRLSSLCVRINKMAAHNPKHTMCQAHIAKVTASLVRMCGNLQRGVSWRQLATLVTQLPLPDNGANEELAAIVKNNTYL